VQATVLAPTPVPQAAASCSAFARSARGFAKSCSRWGRGPLTSSKGCLRPSCVRPFGVGSFSSAWHRLGCFDRGDGDNWVVYFCCLFPLFLFVYFCCLFPLFLFVYFCCLFISLTSPYEPPATATPRVRSTPTPRSPFATPGIWDLGSGTWPPGTWGHGQIKNPATRITAELAKSAALCV
jgi:hypothetical protein